MKHPEYSRYDLVFKEPAITSRSTMLHKETYFIRIFDETVPEGSVVGEVPLFRGLSAEDTPGFEQSLREYCSGYPDAGYPSMSSLAFGIDSVKQQISLLNNPDEDEIRIPINGLVWMGDKRTMSGRIRQKLDAGFRCVKLKIGCIKFEDELDLLRYIRNEFSPSDLELRVDANGAFTPAEAPEKLKRLSEFSLHSIEQPIRQGQWERMRKLCETSPIPIALDEELIGPWCARSDEEMDNLLESIRPQYIILKPSLCGGFKAADRWISRAEKLGIGWWATSALESNIGLTAIAHWVKKHNPVIPQGLGTGALYTNNFPSPLRMEGDELVLALTAEYIIPELDWK
ncbi:MAG: o-succinylbenzoate synthase [Muribaculaceae bacterium]|nr:o-succinylbenzoate synthase [Muribaculaceae bacterium]